jgi:hypothetical protein
MMAIELKKHGKGHFCDMKTLYAMIIIEMSYAMLEQARGTSWL